MIMSEPGDCPNQTSRSNHDTQAEPPEADQDGHAAAAEPNDKLPSCCRPSSCNDDFLCLRQLPVTVGSCSIYLSSQDNPDVA